MWKIGNSIHAESINDLSLTENRTGLLHLTGKSRKTFANTSPITRAINPHPTVPTVPLLSFLLWPLLLSSIFQRTGKSQTPLQPNPLHHFPLSTGGPQAIPPLTGTFPAGQLLEGAQPISLLLQQQHQEHSLNKGFDRCI